MPQRLEFDADKERVSGRLAILSLNDGSALSGSAPESAKENEAKDSIEPLIDFLTKALGSGHLPASFHTQSLPAVIRALRKPHSAAVEAKLLCALELYYTKVHFYTDLREESERKAYLSIVDHVYGYRGCLLDRQSILWPHHLGMKLIDELTRDTATRALVELLWKTYGGLRERLAKRVLIELQVYDIPQATYAVAIRVLYEHHIGEDLGSFKSFADAVSRIDFNDEALYPVVQSKDDLNSMHRIALLYAIFSENRLPHWKLRLAQEWSDDRTFLVTSLPTQEALTVCLMCAVGFMHRCDAHSYACIMHGVQLRIDALDRQQRLMGMVVGEAFGKLLSSKNDCKLVFDKQPDERLQQLLAFALHIGDAVTQADGRPTAHLELAPAPPEPDSDDEHFEHESIQLRERYLAAGEHIPKHMSELHTPRTAMAALDAIRAAKDRPSVELAWLVLAELLPKAPRVFMEEHAVKAMDTLVSVPNTFNLPFYDESVQASFGILLAAGWCSGSSCSGDDSSQVRLVDATRRRLLGHLVQLFYGDTKKDRCLVLNVRQRLSVFTRIVDLLSGKLKPISDGAQASLPQRHPMLAKLESGSPKPQTPTSASQQRLKQAIVEHFCLPFYRQASYEFGRFFEESHAVIAERALLFGAVVLAEGVHVPCYDELTLALAGFACKFIASNSLPPTGSLVTLTRPRLCRIDNEHGWEMPVKRAVLLLLRTVLVQWPAGRLDPLDHLPLLHSMHDWIVPFGERLAADHPAEDGSDRQDSMAWTEAVQALQSLTDIHALLERADRARTNELQLLTEARHVPSLASVRSIRLEAAQ